MEPIWQALQSMLWGTTYTLEVLFNAWAPGKQLKGPTGFN
jgi:hypothetical protein